MYERLVSNGVTASPNEMFDAFHLREHLVSQFWFFFLMLATNHKLKPEAIKIF